MRPWGAFLILATAAAFLAGCADHIPVRREVGVSAIKKTGEIPPEFALFNNYDPRVGTLLAGQLCATPYRQLSQKAMPAEPGEILASRIQCEPYRRSLTHPMWPFFAFAP